MARDYEENPFASPQVEVMTAEVVGEENADAQRIRREHIGREASIKSIGLLYYIMTVIFALGCVSSAFMSIGAADPFQTFIMLALSGAYALFALLLGWLGWGLRRFKKPARIAAIILTALGAVYFLAVGVFVMTPFYYGALPAFLFWFTIHGSFLYVLCSRKATTIFSPEYLEIIRQTPYVKYKTSLVTWIALGILLLLFGLISLALWE